MSNSIYKFYHNSRQHFMIRTRKKKYIYIKEKKNISYNFFYF